MSPALQFRLGGHSSGCGAPAQRPASVNGRVGSHGRTGVSASAKALPTASACAGTNTCANTHANTSAQPLRCSGTVSGARPEGTGSHKAQRQGGDENSQGKRTKHV